MNITNQEPFPKPSAMSEARDIRTNPNETNADSRLGRSEEPSEARQGEDVPRTKVLSIWIDKDMSL